jgi:SAM-dependent methyltransferase
VRLNLSNCRSKLLASPHPTWQSSRSRNRVCRFLEAEEARAPGGLRLNVGSGGRRFEVPAINLDLLAGHEVDVRGDVLRLPLKDESLDSIVCTGVLEHVSDPPSAVKEIFRVLKPEGRAFFELPFMQTYHAAPGDYYRWTPTGVQRLLQAFTLLEWHPVAGPASALAWSFQETMAMAFSLERQVLYKIGLRVFGYLAKPISLLDIFLEGHPMAWHAASGFSVLALKRRKADCANG